MRDPKIVLKHLASFKENQTVTDIYRYLYNPEFYKIAYQNIYSKPSQMTPDSNGKTIDGMSEERINKIIAKLKDKSYQPTNLRRVNIPKKSGGTRPIAIPSFEDKLIQEIIRMILEALYEKSFSINSHGFRPQKSCHTALVHLKQKARGTKWWIDCDISKCFENINHVILLNILKEKIREQKFIALINKFLKAGYIENWVHHKTYSGTPQGSIISPILSNIYLDKLDKYMDHLVSEFNRGSRRPVTKEYQMYQTRLAAMKTRIKKGINVEKNIEKYKIQYAEWRKYIKEHGHYDFKNPSFRRLSYVRYADDFLIGVIGSKKEAIQIKNKIQEFLKNTLKLELNEEKSKIVHNSELVRFLGYGVSVTREESKTKLNGNICLWVEYETMKTFIINNRFGKFVCDAQTGKPKLKAIHRPELTTTNELENLFYYNSKIRGLYNYYKLASNVCKMAEFNYIVKMSFLKTLCYKYKTSVAKLYKNKNYCKNKKIGVTYKNKFYEFFNGPFNVVKKTKYEKNVDLIENLNKYFSRNSLIKRMEANKCEYCGTDTGPFEIHHVRKLKDVKGKESWKQLMIARNRKTLVLCVLCHDKLHAGKL